MLSVSMISSGARAVANAVMMSPEKNPCRVKDASSNWYRYDPYMSKVMPSPMKTQMVSPVKSASSAPAPCDELNEVTGLHRNSLFNTPAPAPVAAPVQPQHAIMGEYQYESEQPQQQRCPQQPVAVDEPTPMMQAPQTFQAAAEKPAAQTKVAALTTQQSTKTHYAIVSFKHDSRTFVAPFRIANGDHVVVEGDRGVDVGVVSDITTVTPTYRVPLKIVRRATAKDMESFNQKARKESIVKDQVQGLADSLSLGVQIVDTEFQFDNNKLTVFFDGKKQIDFRKLQRTLFQQHRCRIWVSYMGEIEYNAKLQKVRRFK